jgi:hypothetical protein
LDVIGVSEFSIGERRRTYNSATILNRLFNHRANVFTGLKIAKTNGNETWMLLALRADS